MVGEAAIDEKTLDAVIDSTLLAEVDGVIDEGLVGTRPGFHVK